MTNKDPKLLVLPYPKQTDSPKVHPVEREASAIPSIARVKVLTDKVWFKEGIFTKINLCIAYNCEAAIVISIKFRDVLNEIDIEININNIQAPNTICAGYLVGSVMTMVGNHWCNLLNKHPKLVAINIDVKQEIIKCSPANRWNPKTSVKALHIYSDIKKENSCAQSMTSMYNKIRNPTQI